ncbi:MAG: HIT domain-containing protein [Pseudomonadota bacterium]|nr:HIT domain-containing protein [Pseudomonadota bacterium]MDE3038202.1 HIT domain-containing protein [Pseudomonadota bacterium]
MAYDKNNIFAQILRGEIPCRKVYEDAFAFAFEDIAPAAPKHVLVVPKGEYISLHDFAAHAPGAMVKGFFDSITRVAAKLGLEESGYRIVSNHGPDAAQSVPHFHVHILGGRSLGGLLP